ncbi:hypothetical protein [Peristeroidobacter agariperforans]|uniref:hypothetical protein n=1 Tax=Peristeroidobacter agariperforans TaxID=268404 RepID=UPI00101D2D32|nr:hypothetical protein [Peristeroidobacter agariperforans]
MNSATFDLRVEGNRLGIDIQESAKWSGYFIPMVSLTQLQVGYYGDITERNIAKGLLSWWGDGRACSASGWFVVNDVTYVAGAITAIDLRFEQRCELSSTAALHAKLHWRSDNP